MANIENINKAIAVMKRVKENETILNRTLFDINSWQGYEGKATYLLRTTYHKDTPVAFTEEEALHNCGTTCCLAGWMAVSPEFRGELWIDKYGGIEQHQEVPEEQISALFEITVDEAESLIYPWSYDKIPITVDDVIERLESFL